MKTPNGARVKFRAVGERKGRVIGYSAGKYHVKTEDTGQVYHLRIDDFEIIPELYKVGVSWEMYGFYEIEADSPEEAFEKAENEDLALPDGSYVDGSFKVDRDCEPEVME